MFELLIHWLQWQNLGLFLLLGSVAGLLAGLLGVGGGLIIVPVLLWLFRAEGMAPAVVVHLAVGTSLATIVVTSLSSSVAHHRRGAVRWPLAGWLSPGIVLGAWVGVGLADLLPALWLQRAFAGFAILIGLQMAFGVDAGVRGTFPGKWGMTLAGGVIGIVSVMVGIGGGSLTVPFLCRGGVPMRNAVATSSACGVPIALAGTMGFVIVGWGGAALPSGSMGFVYWPALLGIVPFSILFAPLGVKMAHSLPIGVLRRLFALLLVVVGGRLLV